MLLDEMKDLFTAEEHVGIKQAVAYLNRNQFFHAETPGNAAVRKALTTNKTRKFIDQAFTLLGYQFIFDDFQGWYGILPGEDIAESRSMTMLDTLVLLVVARAYNVGFSDGWIDGKGNVMISFNDFCDTLTSFAAPAGMDIKVAGVRACLSKLEFMGVVDLGEKVEASGDIPMKIRPFVARILTMDVTARIENFIQRKNAETPGAEDRATADDDNLGLVLEN